MYITRPNYSLPVLLMAMLFASASEPAGQSRKGQTPLIERRVEQMSGPPGTAHLNLATGVLTRGGISENLASTALAPAFVNTDSSGFFEFVSNGREMLDWGVVTADTGSDIVGSFTFGYGTTALDPSLGGDGANLNVRFYDGILGFCNDSGRAPTASFSFTGLPGASTSSNATWLLTVDLDGGFEFCHPGQGNPFGFSILDQDYNVYTFTGISGPILCFAGDASDPLNVPDSNGQVDAYDVWDPAIEYGNCIASFFFGGPPSNFSSWYLEFDSVDAVASTQATATKRNTTNPDVYNPVNEPVIGEIYQGTVQSSCGGTAAILGLSRGAGQITTVFGDLLLGTGPYWLFGSFPYNAGVADVTVQVPKDLSQCGISFTSQTIEIGCSNLQLHNAVDLVLGF